MQKIILFILLISSTTVFSQKIDTTFYDNDWKPINDKQLASFYGTKQRINDSIVLIKDYYMTDTLQNKGQYIHGVKRGRWTYYRQDGSIKTDFEFINNGKNKQWFTFDEDQLKPNDEGIYHTVNNSAKFIGEYKSANEYINANFVLPQKAIKNNFTSFDVTFNVVIDEKGKIIKAYELKRVGYWDKNGEFKSEEVKSKLRYNIEEELTKFLLNMPNWEPAIVRNKPVTSVYSIRVEYRK
jgi:antitoxin component YwqK of YwqJK toxin-antitoxin module